MSAKQVKRLWRAALAELGPGVYLNRRVWRRLKGGRPLAESLADVPMALNDAKKRAFCAFAGRLDGRGARNLVQKMSKTDPEGAMRLAEALRGLGRLP